MTDWKKYSNCAKWKINGIKFVQPDGKTFEGDIISSREFIFNHKLPTGTIVFSTNSQEKCNILTSLTVNQIEFAEGGQN